MQETKLCTQQEALHHYLDSLLAEIPGRDEETPAPCGNTPDASPPPPVENTPVAGETIPAWAREPFKALMFELDGMKVAAPLTLLSGVVADAHPSCPPGLPAWCRGVLMHHDSQVLIVDTAAVVSASPIGQAELATETEDSGQQYVLVGEGRFALACDVVSGLIDVAPQDVRWRGRGKGRRPWYVGIISDTMCALLDIDELCAMLRANLSPMA